MAVISGAAHDIDHPGTNNMFEIKCRSKLAILYNDQSVLENHHCASFFFLIDNNQNNCNIFEDLEPAQKSEIRKNIIENILATDMTKHAAIMQDLKALVAAEDKELGSKNKQCLIKAMVHAVDIGNPARKFEIAKLWA